MLFRETGRGTGADRAHRKMNGAAPQSDGEPFNAGACGPKRDVENGVVARQHADDDLAVEQIGDIGCRLETEFCEIVHPVLAADIGDYSTSGGGQVCRHGRPHAPQADKADLALHQHRGRERFVIGDEDTRLVGQGMPPDQMRCRFRALGSLDPLRAIIS